MLSGNQLKFIHSLTVKKYRQLHRRFVIEGEKMVGELLRQSRIAVDAVYGLEPWAAGEPELEGFRDKFQAVTESELKKISGLNTPNSVLAVAVMPGETPDFSLPDRKWCFYLDGIQDPGNLGAIMRIADWFGMPAVFCSPDCVDVYNSKVVQASMGAIFRVHCWETPLPELLAGQADITVAGAVLDGENAFQAGLPEQGLLVIGNEGRGISAPTDRLLTRRLNIPRHPDGGAESLNAAIAAGILAALCINSRF